MKDQVVQLRNGALARVNQNGGYRIIQGAGKAWMDSIRRLRGGNGNGRQSPQPRYSSSSTTSPKTVYFTQADDQSNLQDPDAFLGPDLPSNVSDYVINRAPRSRQKATQYHQNR